MQHGEFARDELVGRGELIKGTKLRYKESNFVLVLPVNYFFYLAGRRNSSLAVRVQNYCIKRSSEKPKRHEPRDALTENDVEWRTITTWWVQLHKFKIQINLNDYLLS